MSDMHMHPASAHSTAPGRSDALVHVRTYERTNADSLHQMRDRVEVGNAREAVARIYLVEWPHFSFVKIGVTTGQRWTGFASRGGVLRHLTEPAYPQEALARETEMHRQIRSTGWPQAFDCKEAAVPFLGHGGAGWTECYRVGEPGQHSARLYAIDQLAEARRRGA